MKPKHLIYVASLLVIAALAITALNHTMQRQQEEISRQLRASLDSQARISTLIHQLGYTGFIHNFKNYVLRGEEPYYQATLENLKQLSTIFKSTQARSDNPSIDAQVKLIEQVVHKYELKLEQARMLHNQGASVEEIDQLIRVDDMAASAALRDLITQFHIQSAQLLREDASGQRRRDTLLQLVLALSVGTVVVVGALSWVALTGLRARLQEHSKISSRQKLLDAAPNPILVVTESGIIVVANQGAAKLFECESDALIGREIEEFIPEAARGDHIEYRNLFFRSGGERTMRNPVALSTARNEIKRVEVQIGLYQIEQERFAVVNLLDVSKVENIERHAAQLEEHFRMTFELAPVGIAQISLEGHFLKVNRQLAAILGYPRRDLEEMKLDDLTPVMERNANRLTIRRLISGEVEHLRFEKRLLDSKGQDVWVTFTMTPYRGETSVPEYLIAIIEDISYRRKYEEELLASEAKFKSIANHVNAVVWMSTPGITKVLFVSNRYEEIWGRTIESLMHDPTSFMDAVLPEDRHLLNAEVDNHRKGIWDVNYRILGRDGTVRYIHDEGLPVRSAAGELLFMVGMARDVTEERMAQKKLEQSNRQLEQLAKFDPLTMAVRRPYAIADLNECIALQRRYGTVATLLFIDLNDFKQVNDNYGHEAGDQVLVEFSKCIRANVRETDGFYRYAGDEFLLLLRETGAGEAAQFIKKLDEVLVSIRLSEYDDVGIAISYGAVTLGEVEIGDANHWIKLADERMYQHKKSTKPDSR